jgi:hypothetical protein
MPSSINASGGPSRTRPSMQPDSSRLPRGNRAKINPNTAPENKLSLTKQNISAKLLAENGYDIEQLPESHKAGDKQPDYAIEGLNFDHYASY